MKGEYRKEIEKGLYFSLGDEDDSEEFSEDQIKEVFTKTKRFIDDIELHRVKKLYIRVIVILDDDKE